MKIFIYLIVSFAFTSFQNNDSKVYICGATGAKKYHYNENCSGLNACNHQIYKVPLKEAQNYGLTLCGWED